MSQKLEYSLNNAPLGRKSLYINSYTPDLLFPIPRSLKRDEIQVPADLPFSGYDIWNGFELSWLNQKGKPVVGIGEFIIPCETPNLIESKSFKLYLNSFNQSRFESFDQVKGLMKQDLSLCAGGPVDVVLHELRAAPSKVSDFEGICLDDMDIECTEYLPQPLLLFTEQGDQPGTQSECLYTHLLKSNCLVTGQPDWGSVEIRYVGEQINHEGLLKYIVSLRNHNEFHEQCVERIFMDLLSRCRPRKLSVFARYTRRGGLDINPYRTTEMGSGLARAKGINTYRLIRQ